jgi:hypothetical protein
MLVVLMQSKPIVLELYPHNMTSLLKVELLVKQQLSCLRAENESFGVHAFVVKAS